MGHIAPAGHCESLYLRKRDPEFCRSSRAADTLKASPPPSRRPEVLSYLGQRSSAERSLGHYDAAQAFASCNAADSSLSHLALILTICNLFLISLSLYLCVHTGCRPAVTYRVASIRHIRRRPSTATHSCPYTIARPTADHGRGGPTWRCIRSECIAIRSLAHACTFYISSPPIHHSVYIVVLCTSTGIATMTPTDRIQKIVVARFVPGQALNVLTPSPAR